MTARRLSPGFYEDENGAVHVEVRELLVQLGLPDTPANRDLVSEWIASEFRRLYPNIEISEC